MALLASDRARLNAPPLGASEDNASRKTEQEMQRNSQPVELVLKSQAAPHPDSVEAARDLADTYADQNRWDEAIEQYQIAVKLDSASSDLYNSLGIAYEEVGRLEEAERAYQQAIALNAKDSMPYYNLAIMYEKQQRIPEAVQAYRKCLQYSTDPSEHSEVKKKVIDLTSETSTGQSRLAYRLAAGVLFLGIFINIVSVVIGGGVSAIASSVIDLVLAFGLLQFRPGARKFTLFRAGAGAILIPFLAFVGNDVMTAIVMSVIQWGYCGALILLLTGQSKTWRLILGLGIFVVFTLGVFAVLLLLLVVAKAMGMH